MWMLVIAVEAVILLKTAGTLLRTDGRPTE
jgi:hypothetical protein